jgi:hypothetical protein
MTDRNTAWLTLSANFGSASDEAAQCNLRGRR